MIGRVAGYELLEKIGGGGMGVVFKGRDSRLDRVVAVKILRDDLARDPEYRTRFLREARAEASLNHTSIATCFDVGEARLHPPDLLEPGSPGPHPERVLYLVMEYVPGSDLLALVHGPPLAISRVVDIGIQICAGLESAHAAGIIHRDLKSANIRLMADDHIKIVDFGLARIENLQPTGGRFDVPAFSTSRERVHGSVHYMSPEQARGRTTDPRTDLFALGVILYQLVTGRLPFTGDSDYQVANSVASDEPAPLARYASRVPHELQRIVSKLLEKDVDHRYQSAHEVRTDLERLRRGGSASRPWFRRAPMPVRIAAAVLGVVLAGWLVLRFAIPRPVPSIAVMPFENRTGDARLEYLGDGMAANLIADLVRSSRFNVTSFTTARGLEPGQRTAAAASRQLGVSSVVEGALIREGGITYIDVQLTDGKSGFVRWTDRFAYVLNDAANIEQQIARRVVGQIGPWRLAPPLPDRTPATRSPTAYDLCLRAGAFLEDPGDPQGADKALEQYARALEVDPDFALAWAGESLALWKIWNRDKTQESIRRAEEAANRAVRLNPELLEARLARAQIYRANSRYAESIRELQDILKVNPSWTEAWIHLAASYRQDGQMEKSVAALRKAAELQPDYWKVWRQLGTQFFNLARYDDAALAFKQVIKLIPEENTGYELLGAVETKRANYSAALTVYQQLPSPVTTATLAANIGTAYYFEGKLDEARPYYQQAIQLEPRSINSLACLADLYAREGKADSARAEYTRAMRVADDQLHVDPKNTNLTLDRALLMAKLDQCDAAQASLAEVLSQLSQPNAEQALRIAKIEAVCHRNSEAITALRRALSLGAAWAYVRVADEFRPLARDPAFTALARTKKS